LLGLGNTIGSNPGTESFLIREGNVRGMRHELSSSLERFRMKKPGRDLE
jgi:hypothetical protein